LLGAVQHHCERLAVAYVEIVSLFAQVHQHLPVEGHVADFIFQAEPYYEFDALLSAAWRTWEALRYLLWNLFNRDKSRADPPSTFPDTLNALDLPAGLRMRLNGSWMSQGALVKEYRDCIHHFARIDYEMARASMHLADFGVWTVQMRIPDNPRARSRRKFTFTENRDALNYGLDFAQELLDVTKLIADATTHRSA
jgi:hypothetical protein